MKSLLVFVVMAVFVQAQNGNATPPLCSDDIKVEVSGEDGVPTFSKIADAFDSRHEELNQLRDAVVLVKRAVRDHEEKLSKKSESCGCVKNGCGEEDQASMGISKSYATSPARYDSEAYCLDIVKASRDEKQTSHKNLTSVCLRAASQCKGVKPVVDLFEMLDTANDDLKVVTADLSCLRHMKAVAAKACPQCAADDAKKRATGPTLDSRISRPLSVIEEAMKQQPSNDPKQEQNRKVRQTVKEAADAPDAGHSVDGGRPMTVQEAAAAQ